MPFAARRLPGRFILVLALGATLVVTTGVQDATARRRRPNVTATINGRHRRWGARKITVTLTGGLVAIIATVKRPHRLNQFIPQTGITCALDLAGAFPVTPAFPQLCIVTYSELRFSRNPSPKSWGGNNYDGTATVTFDSYSGGRLTGTFHGTLMSQDTPPNPPVIEDGTFSVDVGG
jgi:hypothetical protein